MDIKLPASQCAGVIAHDEHCAYGKPTCAGCQARLGDVQSSVLRGRHERHDFVGLDLGAPERHDDAQFVWNSGSMEAALSER